nr:lamin tail domain-containing protein [Chitinophagaceae bacterium]
MRKIYSGIFLFLFSFLLSRADAQVVISQVYGGGGNSGATYTNDFIELFNRGTEAVNVTGWSVQYASATGTSWQVTTLSGTIPAGGYYLVQEGAGTGGTTPLPSPDASGSINMSGTTGKVALVNNNTALTGSCPGTVIDLVGFGTTANCFEGTAATPAPSNTLAVLRAGNGCTDNNTNSLDFATGAPNPRNSASPLQSCAACNAPSGQATALNLTPAITSIDGSFTAAADADGYLVLISTAVTLSQTPGNGASFSAGNTLGNATVAAVGNTTTFSTSGLNAATTYYITVFAYKNTGPCYNLVTPLAGSVTTAANPAPTASVGAGNNAAEPATNGSFTVTLSAAAPAGGVTITYSLGGTATLNADYTDALNGNLTIAEGQNSGTISLAVTDDAVAEPAKTISITLLTVNNGYVISNAAASIDLADDDIPAALPLVTSYSQNFNTLASAGTGNVWTDNSTIPGWYATRTTYNAANGSSNAGALYSFG